MIEIQTWLFVALVIGLIISGILLEVQQTKINKLKKKIAEKK
jgi:hypothetical protein